MNYARANTLKGGHAASTCNVLSEWTDVMSGGGHLPKQDHLNDKV